VEEGKAEDGQESIQQWGKSEHYWAAFSQEILTVVQPAQRTLNAPPYDPNQQNYFARNHRSRGLPPPNELAARIEEAKTSGKLLLQVLQSTPPSEVLYNELIKEFAERCQSASRSIQSYIHAENPSPDDDTLLTLIETNEQLSLAMSKHQRALLQARRGTGAASASPSPPPGPPPGPPPRREENQTPFSDQSQSHPWQSQSLPPPLEPYYYGSMAPPGPPPGPPSVPPNGTLQGEQSGAYHPGERHTPSYVHRQESSIDNTTMHGAPPSGEHDGPVSPGETRQAVTYRY